ncbi:hypothetical protein [Photobacterium lucens]|uniref:hypothetical protein n=1 Tax=Photobacterium lucens TaxID=2562949 RepID=UPI0006B53546|nr:hypothetical protein [Photobacterium lucens]KPA51261.1 hypothetical protein VT25_18730 [Photobacterium leiognathi subsp. mandapamensis]MBP2699327.1 hypothetical protein [Vibrio parahaemolyticus]MZG56426.1 hypothetical protein [Photobacterium lucens]MZG81515.1 hypothetical protein [Photobacterium lucens]PSV18820.1 hypothetical protein C0W44_17710 [Photobacterium leiognathi subsp. mandapamensis]
MQVPLKVGKDTLLDPNAIEYQWIRNLTSEGVPQQQINNVIQHCLGGTPQTAELMRQIAIKQSSIHELLKLI